jgi:hypothetical protein
VTCSSCPRLNHNNHPILGENHPHSFQGDPSHTAGIISHQVRVSRFPPSPQILYSYPLVI